MRHVLVQAAWHYRHAPQRTKALARRQAGQPAAVTDVAHELAGFVWALARAHTDHQAAQAQAASASLPAAATVAACARTTMLNGRWPVDGRQDVGMGDAPPDPHAITGWSTRGYP